MNDEYMRERIFEELKDVREELKQNTNVTAQGFREINGRIGAVEIAQARLDERINLGKPAKLDAKVISAMVAALGVMGYVITKLIEVFAK